MKLVFIAMPAAGKGTYAEILKKDLNIPHLSFGQITRVAAANGDATAIKAVEYQNKGLYTPDDIVVEIFKKRLSEPDCENGFILDSTPGNVAQAKAFEDFVKIDRVLFFDAPFDVRMHRITGRLTCKECGQIYHKIEVPPKQEGVCDKCGGELYQRADQQEDVVKKRFETYEKMIRPLVEYYKENGLLRTVDSSKSIRVAKDQIMGDIHKAIEDLK